MLPMTKRIFLESGASTLSLHVMGAGENLSFALVERKGGASIVLASGTSAAEESGASIEIELGQNMTDNQSMYYPVGDGRDGLFVVVVADDVGEEELAEIASAYTHKPGPGDIKAGTSLEVVGGTFMARGQPLSWNTITPEEVYGSAFLTSQNKLRVVGGWSDWKATRVSVNITCTRGGTAVVVTPTWTKVDDHWTSVLVCDGLNSASGTLVQLENTLHDVDQTLFILSSPPSFSLPEVIARQRLDISVDGSSNVTITSAALSDP